jgi:hypothetical protein
MIRLSPRELARADVGDGQRIGVEAAPSALLEAGDL